MSCYNCCDDFDKNINNISQGDCYLYVYRKNLEKNIMLGSRIFEYQEVSFDCEKCHERVSLGYYKNPEGLDNLGVNVDKLVIIENKLGKYWIVE